MEGGGNRYLLGRQCKKEDGGADSLSCSNMDAFHNKDVDAQVFDKLRNLKEAQMKIQKDLNQTEKQRGGDAGQARGKEARVFPKQQLTPFTGVPS